MLETRPSVLEMRIFLGVMNEGLVDVPELQVTTHAIIAKVAKVAPREIAPGMLFFRACRNITNLTKSRKT